MKLLYLYIRSYGILQDVEFNFDSGYRFHFDLATRQLMQRDPENKLDDDFFSINKKGNDRVVESVSALIGNNGAGKTSIAGFFNVLVARKECEHILIWEKTGAEKLYYSSLILPDDLSGYDEYGNHKILSAPQGDLDLDKEIEFRLINLDKTKGVIEDDSKFMRSEPELPFKFIYNSNAFTPTRNFKWENEKFLDISTTNLVHDSYTKDRDREQIINAYIASELNDNIRFFAEYQLRELSSFDFPVPFGLYIYPNTSRLDTYIANLEGIVQKTQRGDKQIDSQYGQSLKYIKKIKDIVLSKFDSFYIKTYLTALADCLLVDRQYKYLNYTTGYLDEVLRQLTENSDQSKVSAEHIFHVFNQLQSEFIENFLEDGVRYKMGKLTQIISIIQELNLPIKNRDGIQITIKDPEQLREIIKLIDLYYNIQNDNISEKSFLINRYFSFSFNPRPSAGEQAQFSLYSRIYSQRNSSVQSVSNITPEDIDIVVFFDEIEITIHPELQRKLISNVIKFLEEFYPEHKVHLIFATHSPVLLSDIPKSNVCFLKRTTDKNGNPVVENVTNKMEDNIDKRKDNTDEIENTFGANIHSLYRHSFFMKNGSIGALAMGKIEYVIKQINTCSISKLLSQKDQLVDIIKLIGEPVIRKRLYSLMNERITQSGDLEKQIAYHREMAETLEKHSKRKLIC